MYLIGHGIALIRIKTHVRIDITYRFSFFTFYLFFFFTSPIFYTFFNGMVKPFRKEKTMNIFTIAFVIIMTVALVGAIATMFTNENEMEEIGISLGR